MSQVPQPIIKHISSVSVQYQERISSVSVQYRQLIIVRVTQVIVFYHSNGLVFSIFFC